MDFLFKLVAWFALGYLTRDIFEFIMSLLKYRRKRNE